MRTAAAVVGVGWGEVEGVDAQIRKISEKKMPFKGMCCQEFIYPVSGWLDLKQRLYKTVAISLCDFILTL